VLQASTARFGFLPWSPSNGWILRRNVLAPLFLRSRDVRVDAGTDSAGPCSVRRRHPRRRVVVGRREPIQVCEGRHSRACTTSCRLIPAACPPPSSARHPERRSPLRRRAGTYCATPAATPSPTKAHDTRAIQGWLGHRSITSTAVYTALAPNRFKDFWRD
jgi:hypothetical protein